MSGKDPRRKIDIKGFEEPKKGKVVSQKQYEKIMDKKSKEMMEKFKSRRGFEMNGMDFKMGN